MANRFWVGGTNTWNATAGTKWATTSGGAGGAAIPTTADDVFFDAASGAVSVAWGAGIACKSMNCTGFTGTTTGSTALTISAGSLTWGAGMTESYTGTITMADTSGTTMSITSNGIQSLTPIIINGAGGVFRFADTFNSTKAFTVTAGTFNQNSQAATSLDLLVSGSTTRSFTTSAQWTVTGSGVTTLVDFTTTTGLTFSATTGSQLIIAGTNAMNHTFQTGGLTWNDLSFAGNGAGTLSVSGGTPTFRDLTVSNTGASTITLGVTTVFRGMDFTGFNGTFAGTNGISFSGGLTLGAGMTYSSTSTLSATATSGTQTITFNGIAIKGQLNMTGAGGTREFADLAAFSTAATNLSVQAGTLNTNNHDASFSGIVSLSSSTTRVVNMGSAKWTLTGTGSAWNPGTTTGLTFNAGTSEIILNDASATSKSFVTAGLTYYIVRFKGAGSGTFNVLSSGGGGTFYNLDISGAAHSVVFPSAVTQTFTTFGLGITVPGISSQVITFTASTPGSAASWFKLSGRQSVDWCSFKDITGTGGAVWYVGRNSTNVSGNHGLRFTGLILFPWMAPQGSSGGTVVNIVLIADSYGHGQTASGTQNAFRNELQILVNADNISGTAPGPYVFNWIGPIQFGVLPTNNMDAVPGSSTISMLQGSTSPPAPVPCTPVANLFGGGNPFPSVNVYIVGPIGHNDSLVSYSNTVGFTSGIIPLVTKLDALTPGSFYVLTTVGGQTSGTFDSMLAFFNATAVPTLQTNLGPGRVEPVDVYSGYDQVVDFVPDGGHWSPTGYTLTANNMHEAFRRQLTRAVGGTP